jgi:hypothetical protein
MTPLKRPIVRSLVYPIERRQWCVEIDSVGVTFRQKRCRERFSIGWASIFYRAMDINASETRKKRA